MKFFDKVSAWFERKLIKKLRTSPFNEIKISINVPEGAMDEVDYSYDMTALLYDIDGNIMAQNAHVGFFNEISSALRPEKGIGIDYIKESEDFDGLVIRPNALSDVVGKIEVLLSIQHPTAVFGAISPVIKFDINKMLSEKFEIGEDFPYSNNAILITLYKDGRHWYITRDPKAIFGMDAHQYYMSKVEDSAVLH